MKDIENKSNIKRIGGYLYRIISTKDATGKVVHNMVSPFMVELRPRDILQIIVGATILAVPVGFTEETWVLGSELSFKSVLLLLGISLLFISAFVYFNFYRFYLKRHITEYIKRVIAIYILSAFIVGGLLTVIGKCPWGIDNILAIKRIIIVTFPSSMGATISDTIK